MALRVEVTSVTKEKINLDVYNGETLVKQLRKSHESLVAFSGLLTKWHPTKVFQKIPNPNGWFAPALADIQKGLQVYFAAVIKELPDSFAVKAFFRLYDLKGKVVIITGASSGLGRENAIQLAEMGAHLIFGCRSEAKTQPVIAEIKAKTGNEQIEFIPLDLLSLASVNAFVETFKAKDLPLHLLINNAGGAVVCLTEYGVDGTFGSNHVGPVLLTLGLLDILKRTENSRVIFVASIVAGAAKGLPWERIHTMIPLGLSNPVESYSYAKLANILGAKVLAEKIKEEERGGDLQPLVFSLHPGVVATDVWRNMPFFVQNIIKRFMMNAEEGSWMTLYLSTIEKSEVSAHSGAFFDYTKGTTPPPQLPLSEDKALQQKCWEETLKMCGWNQ